MPDAGGQQPRRCFVVSPIGQPGSPERKHADWVLNAIIRPVAEQKFDYVVRRGEEAGPGMINDDVVQSVLEADLVIADLTFLNPNVFYELGIRHAVEKPVIHLASADTRLPFDNAGYRTVLFDLSDWHKVQSAQHELALHIAAIDAPDFRVNNPVTQVKDKRAAINQNHLLEKMREAVGLLERRVRDLGHLAIGGANLSPEHAFHDSSEDQIISLLNAMRHRIDREISSAEPSLERNELEHLLLRLSQVEESLNLDIPKRRTGSGDGN
ncbi:MAG: hypothetical protein R3D44_02830 [Hyphomicrobiaceae bacterium]